MLPIRKFHNNRAGFLPAGQLAARKAALLGCATIMLVGQVSYLPGNWQLGKPTYALFEHKRLANLQWVDLNRGAGLDQALEFLRVCLQGMHRNGVFRF
jgi:hypothetical protein